MEGSTYARMASDGRREAEAGSASQVPGGTDTRRVGVHRRGRSLPGMDRFRSVCTKNALRCRRRGPGTGLTHLNGVVIVGASVRPCLKR